jgi:hypothetical protein
LDPTSTTTPQQSLPRIIGGFLCVSKISLHIVKMESQLRQKFEESLAIRDKLVLILTNDANLPYCLVIIHSSTGLIEVANIFTNISLFCGLGIGVLICLRALEACP